MQDCIIWGPISVEILRVFLIAFGVTLLIKIKDGNIVKSLTKIIQRDFGDGEDQSILEDRLLQDQAKHARLGLNRHLINISIDQNIINMQTLKVIIAEILLMVKLEKRFGVSLLIHWKTGIIVIQFTKNKKWRKSF